jgi:hypothetical protein
MFGQNLLTALLFYLPFLLTIVFGLFALIIGILTIFSGTLLVLVLATYGLYSFLRDMGYIETSLQKCKSIWQYISHDVEQNLQTSFELQGSEKLPKTPALFLCHPHGLIGYSWMLHFCYGISKWPVEKPKPFVAIHSILFRIPLVRDVLEQFRCIEAKEEIVQTYLRKGNSVALVTGGIEEMMYNGDETVKLVLKKRRGYARIAKTCGVPIVPMFTVGENELFPNETFWVWKQIASLIYKWTKIYVPLPSWTSMKHWVSILRKPLEEPVKTFVLGVIDTENKSEAQIRKETIQCFSTFFKDQSIQAEFME